MPRDADVNRLLDWLQNCDIDSLEEAELDAALEILGVDLKGALSLLEPPVTDPEPNHGTGRAPDDQDGHQQ